MVSPIYRQKQHFQKLHFGPKTLKNCMTSMLGGRLVLGEQGKMVLDLGHLSCGDSLLFGIMMS